MRVETQIQFATLLAQLLKEGREGYKEIRKDKNKKLSQIVRRDYEYTIWIALEALRRSDNTGYLVARRLCLAYDCWVSLSARQLRRLKEWDNAINSF